MEKKDIFDRMMALPGLRVFEPIYKKYKEILLYLFFGFLTFVLSVSTYVLFNQKFGINELLANIISWLIAVMFAFITNYIWVFQVRENTLKDFLKQMFGFYMGRLFTLCVEEVILAIFVIWMQLDGLFVKVIAQIIVIVLNYVISKLIIFRK